MVPLAVTAVAARLGPVALGGQQIAYRIWYLLSLSLDALAVPAQVYVSAALGWGDRGRPGWPRAAPWCSGSAPASRRPSSPARSRSSRPAFTADPAIRHDAVIGLLGSALTQPLAALAYVYDGDILGLGDYVAMRRAMLLAIVAFVPLAILVLRFHWLGLPGVWAALGCGWPPGRCCWAGAGRGRSTTGLC